MFKLVLFYVTAYIVLRTNDHRKFCATVNSSVTTDLTSLVLFS